MNFLKNLKNIKRKKKYFLEAEALTSENGPFNSRSPYFHKYQKLFKDIREDSKDSLRFTEISDKINNFNKYKTYIDNKGEDYHLFESGTSNGLAWLFLEKIRKDHQLTLSDHKNIS